MTRQLVLVGAGLAHVHLLARWARRPLPGVQITLVAPQPRLMLPALVPGFVAGRSALEDCSLALEPLVRHSGARWLTRAALALDPVAQAVLLDDGNELRFDTLSLNGSAARGPDTLEQTLPGARKNGLLTQPPEAFCALWPRVPELAQTRALRVAVICHAAASQRLPAWPEGITLALAVRHRLPACSVTLITGATGLLGPDTQLAPGLQTRIRTALRERHITVLPDAATGIEPGEVTLATGARLACDVPLILRSASPPAWLTDSGLALDGQGFVAVDGHGRSASHATVFALGEASTSTAGGYRRLHQVLDHFIRKVLATASAAPAGHDAPVLTALTPSTNRLTLLSCADGQGIAAWGAYSSQGRWAGWLADRLNRRLLTPYRQ